MRGIVEGLGMIELMSGFAVIHPLVALLAIIGVLIMFVVALMAGGILSVEVSVERKKPEKTQKQEEKVEARSDDEENLPEKEQGT